MSTSKFVVIFLLCSISIFAETDSQYQIFNISLNADVDLNYASPVSRLVYFDSDLYLFPKNEFNQEVLELNVNSDPLASVKQANIINYKWEGDKDNIYFGYDAKVKVNTLIKRIDYKISLPDQFVEQENLKYVKPSKFININQDIRKKADEITSNSEDLYGAVFDIAEWIRINVKYDLNTLTEDAIQKSSWVLENKYGVCDEITNLFISFLRSKNIPTRYVTGIAFSDSVEKGWDNHAWAEVYFDGIGWVPFDIVFGEYGWIDSGHIKFFDSIDSENHGVDYSWRAINVNLINKELDINAEVLEKGDEIIPFVSLDVNVLRNKVGSESYIPIEVKVKNLQPYYLAPLVYIVNGPKIIGDNAKGVLLGPYEEKNISWLGIADNLPNSELSYEYDIVVTNNFGASDKEFLGISYDYPRLSRNDAEMILKNPTQIKEEILEEVDE